MKVSWTKGLDEQATQDVRIAFKEAQLLRRRMTKVLQEVIEDKRRGQILEALYDNPNWAYLQADRSGYERALRDVIELITE